jgi:hypothetical protein
MRWVVDWDRLVSNNSAEATAIKNFLLDETTSLANTANGKGYRSKQTHGRYRHKLYVLKITQRNYFTKSLSFPFCEHVLWPIFVGMVQMNKAEEGAFFEITEIIKFYLIWI